MVLYQRPPVVTENRLLGCVRWACGRYDRLGLICLHKSKSCHFVNNLNYGYISQLSYICPRKDQYKAYIFHPVFSPHFPFQANKKEKEIQHRSAMAEWCNRRMAKQFQRQNDMKRKELLLCSGCGDRRRFRWKSESESERIN